ncbi:MAG: hypothetical protein OHK93_001202 [Ramalina farinacea]|uniref:Uncharacterized protein n=1 Tax=Ramalina farinacea TaxID=258253 RepID=A0AA43QP31_9LECA|nr:hypothetical protein [Ramalina farinacea]
MAAADSLSSPLPAANPSISVVAPSYPSMATSQHGNFGPGAAEAQGRTPAGKLPAGGHAPAKAGGSRTHRGSQGKRKRTRALENAEKNGVGTKVKQEEEEGETPPLKKIRAEEEEAAAAGDDHDTKNRHERRSALAIENAALRQLLQYVPEDVLQLARQAQEADAIAAAAHLVEEQAHQVPKADASATATPVAEEQAPQASEADTNTTIERKPFAHVAEE